MGNSLQPALLGGAFIGVLSALPFVNAVNCCCCAWVVSGGVLAYYLRQQNSAVQITAGEGALVGLFAGLIGAVIAGVLSIPLQMIAGPIQQQMMDRVLSSNPEMPPEVRDMLERAGGAGGAVTQFAFFFVGLVVNAIFGTLGGLLGFALFKKNALPPDTIDVTPTVV